MSFQLFLKPPLGRWAIALIVGATAFTGATVVYSVSEFGLANKNASPQPEETIIIAKKITALGRLEPQAEIIRLGSPATLRDDRVLQLLVKQGDKVEEGQIIAILESHERLAAALEEAKQQVEVAKARLAQVEAGAKDGEIAAQTATIGRVEAQLYGDRKAQEAAIARFEAQLQGDRETQQATSERFEAELIGERKANLATISRLEAELNNAIAEYDRYQQLYQEGAISNSVFDSKRLSVETSRELLNEAKANLNKIEETGKKQLNEFKVTLNKIEETGRKQLSEARAILNKIEDTGSLEISEAKATLDKIVQVRPVDVQAVKAEVDSAIAAARRAAADLKLTEVRSPMASQVLKINTRPGETIGDSGIVELGETQQMVAIAEVYQTDISKIKLGQQVAISSEAFTGELKGTVSEIGLQVNRQNVFSNQPGENLDRRVIEVKIHLNPSDSQRVSGLTNLQVQVSINL